MENLGHKTHAELHFASRFKRRLRHRVSKEWVKNVTEMIKNHKGKPHPNLRKIAHVEQWYAVDYRSIKVWVLFNPDLQCMVTCLHPKDYPNCGETHHDKELFNKYLSEKIEYLSSLQAPVKFYRRRCS